MLTLGVELSSRIARRRAELSVSIVALSVGVSACSGVAPSDGVTVSEQKIVYGEDDRREYYQVDDVGWRGLFQESVVVLAPRERANQLVASSDAGVDGTRGGAPALPTWSAISDLCAGEPFAEQPSVAFCTGVLVDWDLVLTAGHCANAWSPDQYRVVFGDYYVEEGRLALHASDVYEPSGIVAAVHDIGADGTRIDYAWIRLARPARAPHRPVAIHTREQPLAARSPLLVISAGGGVPLKLDAGGVVIDPRAERLDHFVADTDTSQGSSGAGAFAADLGLIGVLSTGLPDFNTTSAGCRTTRREPDSARASELYTYAARAVEGLCAVTDHPLCDQSCPQPCRVPEYVPPPELRASGGCSISGAGAGQKAFPRLQVGAEAIMCGIGLLLGAVCCRRGAGRSRRRAR